MIYKKNAVWIVLTAILLAGGITSAYATSIKYKDFIISIKRPADTSTKPRVLITTDLGLAGDRDDYQTLVHALMNANKFSLVGIVGSIPTGSKSEIDKVVAAYRKDYNNTGNSLGRSTGFTDPNSIVVRQGASSKLNSNTPSTNISAGAQLIIDKALEDTTQPLYVLGWGSLTDVAQAIHRSPSIVPFIRLVSIGSTNSGYRSCCTNYDRKSRDYLFANYTKRSNVGENLWWVEIETSFRGLYGADSRVESFENSVVNHVTRRGCLGQVWRNRKQIAGFNRPFAGDYNTTLYVMSANRNDPSVPSQAGSYKNSPDRHLYWTEVAENVRGFCSEENGARGRSGKSCWGAALVYSQAQTIANEFKIASNRLNTCR